MGFFSPGGPFKQFSVTFYECVCACVCVRKLHYQYVTLWATQLFYLCKHFLCIIVQLPVLIKVRQEIRYLLNISYIKQSISLICSSLDTYGL